MCGSATHTSTASPLAHTTTRIRIMNGHDDTPPQVLPCSPGFFQYVSMLIAPGTSKVKVLIAYGQ